MNLKLCILISFVIAVASHGALVWEWGSNNDPLAITITNYHGSFGFYEKEKVVKIVLAGVTVTLAAVAEIGRTAIILQEPKEIIVNLSTGTTVSPSNVRES
ncbi:unnamed protein product [Chrysodeixis includens]|uniref:Uncharacterized protein n=1 Tax=Chrysodeixis includens TaxID=689277 RepID=A0A9N8L103_CHRIL|nr:unnamed protein product [Chrysodeixis includens]